MVDYPLPSFVLIAMKYLVARLLFSSNASERVIDQCISGLQAKPAASVSDSSTTSISHISRSSTPPTDVPSALSSPVFAPPVETQESQHRREQSDRASSEIGKRLLKGWAMLGDECPNTRCYGVPLVRPPKVGGGKDPRKVCDVSNIRLAVFNEPQGVRNLWNGLCH